MSRIALMEIEDKTLDEHLSKLLRLIQAHKALETLLIQYKHYDKPSIIGDNFYTKDELEELRLFQKQHLLRRIKEEAIKAGFEL